LSDVSKFHIERMFKACDGHILYHIFNPIFGTFWFIFWKNFDTLNCVLNIGLSTFSEAKLKQMDEFWSNSSWRTFVSRLA